jgi:hypothetical protein
MSVAFQAVVLLALAMPGIIFRRTYSRAGQFRERRSIADELVWGFIAASVFHFVWFSLFQIVGHPLRIQPRLDVVLMLVLGQFGRDNRHFDYVLSSVTDPPAPGFILFIL